MDRPKPLLLVDIDGVLNVYGVEITPPGYREYVVFPDDEEPMRLAAVHGQWLDELGEMFELVWASAWGFQAHVKIGKILNLEEFPFVPMPPIPFPPAEKVGPVAAYAGSRPVAWIDDAITPEAVAWAQARSEPTLLVQIDHRMGLERQHVDELLTWGRSLGDG